MNPPSTVSENNKRIAKNTLMLYVKMGVMMLVQLYTSRVVLQTLGVDDFGIYNVVGGVVVLFSFLNAAMSSATQRFLNFELGKGDLVQVGRVFSMSLTVHFCIAGLVLLLAETVGLWFLNSELNIPAERMVAANWVYQFSVATTLLGILLVPYNATIIAHERMGFYAWTSIVRALMLLGIVYLLVIGNVDKLILYAGLVFAVNLLMQILYVAYCRRAFSQTATYKPFRDKKLFRELMSFSGWSLLGELANLASFNGVNLVMNVFCGVAVNAAMGVAQQVFGAVGSFVSSFQTAFNPQIVKYYSSGEYGRFTTLIFFSSRISFLLLLVVSIPVFLYAEFFLDLWLGGYPEYSVAFIRCVLVFALFDALSGPLWVSARAIGNIRDYQLTISLFGLSNIPVAYFFLSNGFDPIWVMATRSFINGGALIWRIIYLHWKIDFPGWQFAKTVFVRSVLVLLCTAGPLWYLSGICHGLIQTGMFVGVSVVFTAIVSLFMGFNKTERLYFWHFFTSKFKH